MHHLLLFLSFFLVVTSFFFIGCGNKSVQIKPNRGITYGEVQLYLKKGVTTQTEVLEKFGAPNITTHDGDTEVWTYQRHGSVSNASAVGGSTGIVGGFRSGSTQSTQSMILIIKFNQSKMVSDFKTRYSSF